VWERTNRIDSFSVSKIATAHSRPLHTDIPVKNRWSPAEAAATEVEDWHNLSVAFYSYQKCTAPEPKA
jgi:hypothetical protein